MFDAFMPVFCVLTM